MKRNSKSTANVLMAIEKGFTCDVSGITRNPNGGLVKGSVKSGGYLYITIRNAGAIVHVAVHKMIAYAKYGEKVFSENIHIRHLNNNPRDNSWDNIALGSQSENMMDKPVDIRMRAALYATSFVRKHNRSAVVSFYNSTKSYKETMKQFGISSKGTLHFILNN